MAWEDVTEPGSKERVLIDPPFIIRVKRVVTVNINDAVWAIVNGQNVQATAEREEIRLWNGAHFIGMFTDREEVAKVVSQLRAKNMERKKR